jgi:hypothetical protein
MNKNLITLPLAGMILASSAAQAAVIFNDTFTGNTTDLNGKLPTSTTGGAAWVAASNFDRDGSFDGSAGSATLAFTPSNGLIYSLDASISGISGDANWIALGFANGQSVTAANTNRFVSGGVVVGQAWMLARGNNTPNPNAAHTVGTTDSELWTGAVATADGGDLDLRIVLDTTGGPGTWTATWFAKEATDGSYTQVRASEPIVTEANLTSVGFAVSSSAISGTITSFSLTTIPEPSSALLAALGALSLLRRRR